MTSLLLLATLVLPATMDAQGSCQSMALTVEQYEPCRYRLRANVIADCHNEITVQVTPGAFYEVIANAAAGWIVEIIAPDQLLVTHTDGTFPNGNSWFAELAWTAEPDLPGNLVFLYPDLCVLEGCASESSLPGCPGGQLSGTVYRECNMQPLSNQPGLPDAAVQLWNEFGVLLDEQLTDENGHFAFPELPPGTYLLLKSQGPDGKENIPPNGQYTVQLSPSAAEVRNFGVCPECDCDDWDIILQQELTASDTAFINLFVNADNRYCLERYELSIDSGEIIGMELIPDGWEGEIINGQQATLQRVATFDDWTTFVFHRWRVAIDYGIKEKGIKATIRLIGAGNQPPEPVCIDSIIIEDPTRFKQFTCCPEGSTLGAELVQNGEFYSVQAPATDYNYLPYPNLPGEIAIVNNVTSSFWLQASKNGGPFDHFLAVNGSTVAGLAAWKQQVTGLIGGDNYVFCGLFNNLFRPNLNADDPVIELVIEDDISAQTWSSGLFILPENPDLWEKIALPWVVPAVPASSYTLKVISHGTNPFGNDFGVDCISFRECIAPPQDTCCKDLEAFCDDLENGLTFSFDSCKVTMNLNGLLPCYSIEWVDWGNGPQFGPWTPSTFPYPMHTFSGNGTYAISYLAIAYNDSNFICIEKVVEDTIVVLCEPCFCNQPEITLNHNGLDYTLSCSKVGPLLQLPCPAGDLIISGFFGCETATGELCDETPVQWSISGPNNYFDSGVTTNFQALFLLQQQISAPGLYTVTYSTLCQGAADSCLCVVQWIQQDCDTCYCSGFSDMFVRTPQGAMNLAVTCDGPSVIIPCPDPGKGFHLTGVFGCAGGACPPDHHINWALVHQSSGMVHSGSFQDNDPYFGLYILPTYISQPGLYTLTLTGVCQGDTCACVLEFIIDCTKLCPCDIADINDFSDRTDKGFAHALANKSCKACFSPLAVNDCETVEWFVNATSGTPIGTSVGSESFCYTFPFSGTYTIYMVVTRLKPDGTLCEVFTFSKTITISCLKKLVCEKTVFPNPGFGEGAVAGNMTTDGVAPGWVGEGLYPTVLEGVPESEDAWSVLLTGCYFTSDILTSAEPVCLSKTDAGTLILRLRTPGDPIPGADIKVGKKPPGGNRLSVVMYNDKAAPPPHPCESEKEGCNRIATLTDLAPLDSTDWYDVYIPYDLSQWTWTDSCGDMSSGTPIYLSLKMSNMLSADQGDGIVRDALIIDHICMDGELVSIQPPATVLPWRLHPNPTSGEFTVTLPQAARAGTRLLVMGLTGVVALDQAVPEGSLTQTVDVASLPPGIYFVQVFTQGLRQAAFRMVKY